MYVGTSVFSQLMEFAPRYEFRQIVKRYKGDRRVRRFSCWEQFLVMAFAQLTYRESLRDIETCLRSLSSALYHVGIRTRVARSTLADANEHRTWQIYRDLTLVLIRRARALYCEERFLASLDAAIYALDATNIKLCLKLFPWATAPVHQATAAGVKLHTQLDVQAQLPVFAEVSRGNVNERLFLDDILFEPGAFYLMDRGYVDFARLRVIDQAGAFFVIRAKRDLRFDYIDSRPADRLHGVRADQTIRLAVPLSLEYYPDHLRRVKVMDLETHHSIVLLTNNFVLDALTVGELYRSRWQVELFFKWIKQHLRIKAFYGTTFNAVTTQIWIALATFVLVAIAKKVLHLEGSLYSILQILSVTLFEKAPIHQVLSANAALIPDSVDANQLTLFNF
jgi:hypothetical protein